jgi:serine/threonine protein kinase
VRVLASINHPNVVGYKQAFVDRNDNSLWYFMINNIYYSIILEYADGGNLLEYIE